MEQIHAVILAAGRSERLGNVDKLWVTLNGKPLIQWSIEAFNSASEISGITLVTQRNTVDQLSTLVSSLSLQKPVSIIVGGSTRMESVSNACDAIDEAYIAIHDGARPCITPNLINLVCSAARGNECACLSVPVVETLVRTIEHHETERIHRENLTALQTPQVIRLACWREGKSAADALSVEVTDDTHMATLLHKPIVHVLGDRNNIKVTYVDDIVLAGQILRQSKQMEYRTGFGYDIHQTSLTRECYLGGIHFTESNIGLVGHSDADVLLHAICDALLGAVALGDIGVHFPPSDDKHKGRASSEFLIEVHQLLKANGWTIGNIDATLIAEAPKLMPRAVEVRTHISQLLDVSIEKVSVKATTNEGLGALGKGDGIAAHAVAMVYR
jgi:2-C-methyl-D-erythritol 4-phosphate cytidylyltransferase/2-C-methyl-D-erythritol 2,4-cyclodiphosphate synthase